MPTSLWLPIGYQIRGFQPGDRNAVLELIRADQIPGQPPVTDAMLREALAGRSTVDAGWWAELSRLRVDVLLDHTGQVVGVVSYASRRRDDTGVLLWLHAREHCKHTAALINHVRRRLAGHHRIDAFDFATALSLGLEALPVRHRPITTTALHAAGFTSRDLWRYMRRELPTHEQLTPPPNDLTITIEPSTEPAGWTLTAHRNNITIGDAAIGAPTAGIGVLWWIGVDPTARGQGIGRALLTAALIHLREQGANQVILYVDDDEAGTDRDRTAANHLYDQLGFHEIDRLHSFTTPNPTFQR